MLAIKFKDDFFRRTLVSYKTSKNIDDFAKLFVNNKK